MSKGITSNQDYIEALDSYNVWTTDVEPLVQDIRICVQKIDDNAFKECDAILNKVPGLFISKNLDIILEVINPITTVFSSKTYYTNSVNKIDGLLRKKMGVLVEKLNLLATYTRLDMSKMLDEEVVLTPKQKQKIEDDRRLPNLEDDGEDNYKKLHEKVYGSHDVGRHRIV